MVAAVGLSEANSANAMLNGFRNIPFQVPATYAKLHTGIPGAAGTANAATGDTTRKQVTFSPAAVGALAVTGTLAKWTRGSDASETVTHVSMWDSPTAGAFRWSFALTAPKTWTTTGDTLELTVCGLSLAPIASD